MKNYIALFESFEETFDDFYRRPDLKSDLFYRTVSKELIELANQYMQNPSKLDPHSDRYSTATRINDLQNDLLSEIHDESGEDLAEEFEAESTALLNSYEITEMTKEKMFDKNTDIHDNEILKVKSNKVAYQKPGKKIALTPARTSRSPLV